MRTRPSRPSAGTGVVARAPQAVPFTSARGTYAPVSGTAPSSGAGSGAPPQPSFPVTSFVIRTAIRSMAAFSSRLSAKKAQVPTSSLRCSAAAPLPPRGHSGIR